jgi:hypothetical protein
MFIVVVEQLRASGAGGVWPHTVLSKGLDGYQQIELIVRQGMAPDSPTAKGSPHVFQGGPSALGVLPCFLLI